MTAPDAAAQLVARFLRANHYNETLAAFIHEANLPEDAGSLSPSAWTVEQILQEKVQFDESVKFERKGGDGKHGWTNPAPAIATEPQVDINSNVLCVSGDEYSSNISVTTADRRCKRFSAQAPYIEDPDKSRSGDSPVLSTVFVPGGLVLQSAMSGHLSLRDIETDALIDECRHHIKYAVQVVSVCEGSNWFVATAGWDQTIHFYAPKILESSSPYRSFGDGNARLPGYLGEPVHSIKLPSNPESLLFARHPDTGDIYLVASRRDSTHLFYYHIARDASGQVLVQYTGRQNLAPHSNAWVSFTPCSLKACPTDSSLIAVATSHLPHLKVIVVRLLFPDSTRDRASIPSLQQTQASMARMELALQDREDAAINLHVTTMAPQTPYSTPQVVWRPDGTGLYVNGDDGVIRGVEATTGKVVSLLRGHEVGSKVRTLWAGLMRSEGHETAQEILVSGGFDKKILVWAI